MNFVKPEIFSKSEHSQNNSNVAFGPVCPNTNWSVPVKIKILKSRKDIYCSTWLDWSKSQFLW